METPVFTRLVYDDQMKRVHRPLKACSCQPGQSLAKTKAQAAVCGNCGGAILTPREREYVKTIRRTA